MALWLWSTADSTPCPTARHPGPATAKEIMALPPEARSLSRRADKLSDGAAAVDHPRTQHLCAETCTSMDNLVHHLMLLERQQQRHDKATGRGEPWSPLGGEAARNATTAVLARLQYRHPPPVDLAGSRHTDRGQSTGPPEQRKQRLRTLAGKSAQRGPLSARPSAGFCQCPRSPARPTWDYRLCAGWRGYPTCSSSCALLDSRHAREIPCQAILTTPGRDRIELARGSYSGSAADPY